MLFRSSLLSITPSWFVSTTFKPPNTLLGPGGLLSISFSLWKVPSVRKLFREKLNDYMAKAEAVHNAEIYNKHFAISVCSAEGVESPIVIGAQAANELLNIIGIKASIVLTKYNEVIYVSARSIDEINVQVMMEKLGGGGHRSVAGAQLRSISIENAIKRIKEVITEMIKEGDLL